MVRDALTLSEYGVPVVDVPQTILSPEVPHTILSPPPVPHTMLSQAPPHDVPHTMLSPPEVFAAPHVVPAAKAFARGFSTPPVSRWLPQMTRLLHRLCTGTFCPGWVVA